MAYRLLDGVRPQTAVRLCLTAATRMRSVAGRAATVVCYVARWTAAAVCSVTKRTAAAVYPRPAGRRAFELGSDREGRNGLDNGTSLVDTCRPDQLIEGFPAGVHALEWNLRLKVLSSNE